MRLVTYRSKRGDRAGVLVGREIVDAWDLLGGDGSSVRDVLEAERVLDLATAAEASATLTLADLELLPPVPDPDKIICIGLNYRAHAAEAGIDPPDSPTFFAKFRNALAAPGATVPLPGASSKVDFEAEVAFVIGTECREVEAGEAGRHRPRGKRFEEQSAARPP